jgi:hypothetical protein
VEDYERAAIVEAAVDLDACLQPTGSRKGEDDYLALQDFDEIDQPYSPVSALPGLSIAALLVAKGACAAQPASAGQISP